MAQMQSGDLSRQVALEDLSWSPNAIAVGATDGKTLEITAVDGELWLVGPDSEGEPRAQNTPTGQGATFAVYAEPQGWSPPSDIDATTSEDVLAGVTLAIASSVCAGAEVVPFRVRGRARQVSWSTVGQPEGLSRTDTDVNVTIVGFWAPTKKGVFVPASLDGHLHVVLTESRLAGHLLTLDLEPGATLELPN
jgi:hypothetical protein